jgi:hypothetical protein
VRTRIVAAIAALILWLRELYQRQRVLDEAELATRKKWDEAKKHYGTFSPEQLNEQLRERVKRKRVRR